MVEKRAKNYSARRFIYRSGLRSAEWPCKFVDSFWRRRAPMNDPWQIFCSSQRATAYTNRSWGSPLTNILDLKSQVNIIAAIHCWWRGGLFTVGSLITPAGWIASTKREASRDQDERSQHGDRSVQLFSRFRGNFRNCWGYNWSVDFRAGGRFLTWLAMPPRMIEFPHFYSFCRSVWF